MGTQPHWVEAARAAWTNRGVQRPDFCQPPGPGQESVWDYPRPPAIITDRREIIVQWRGHEVVRTVRALRVLETSHPPTFYLPLEDVDQTFLQAAGGGSYCEWKGAAAYWNLVDGDQRLDRVAWSYPAPLPAAEVLIDRIAFYARGLECTVGDAPVTPQPGGFYGGWVTPELCGPFKGEAGSNHW
jgi:uncharacterized protein (DUF427 family)